MSIHGVCFDEGNSGNCGPDCAAHDSMECTIPGEIIEHMISGEINVHEWQILEFAETYGLSLPNPNEQMISEGNTGFLKDKIKIKPKKRELTETEKRYKQLTTMAPLGHKLGCRYQR